MINRFLLASFFAAVITACSVSEVPEVAESEGTYGNDVSFLKQYVEVVQLEEDRGQAKVVIVPAWQGRVMTSTATGDQGRSFGWLNYELIESGEIQPHINVFGGEDRFWMGPEGGQYSIFFKGGDPFDLTHWQTPAFLDTEPFDLVSSETGRAVFARQVEFQNYSGTQFSVQVDRTIELLNERTMTRHLGLNIPDDISWVAFESQNRITNVGDEAWTKAAGLLSIWILGMFVPSPSTTVVVPFHGQPDQEELGALVNDRYFGKVPSDRLITGNGVLYFRADGKHRAKIGLSDQRAKPVLGSWDAAGKVLTLVQYSKPETAADYVNSMWEIQDQPYQGDVVNSYNDGPPEPGAKPLGPFYELETSSPALELSPRESLVHIHRTIHLTGGTESLDRIAQELLGASLSNCPW